MKSPAFIPGLLTEDSRGKFSKQILKDLPVDFTVKDYFITLSSRNVIRGMHWQSSPCETNRIITLLSGRIFDVTIDMRRNSENFGQSQIWTLDSENWGYLFVPKGFAHGYQVISDTALISYLTDGEYCPEHDNGVLWDSIEIDWPLSNPTISDRDNSFPELRTISDFL